MATRHPAEKDWLSDGIDYRLSLEALQTAFNELEWVTGQLDDSLIARGYDPKLYARNIEPAWLDCAEQTPTTLAEIGEVWAFIDDLNKHLDQLAAERDRVAERLRHLNMARYDADNQHARALRARIGAYSGGHDG